MPKTTASASKSKSKKAGKAGSLTVKQVRSGIGRSPVHRRTLKALGLRHHQDVVQLPDGPAVRGMLFQVRHLVEVKE